MKTIVLLFFLTSFIAPASFADERGARLKISNGLTYSESTCLLDNTRIDLREIQLKPMSQLQMRVLPNPDAHIDHNCQGRYAGKDIIQIMRQKENAAILAVINGNFFRTQQKSKNRIGFVPIGMLWSKIGSTSGKIYENLRIKGGNDLFIVDNKGAHHFILKLESCGKQTCTKLEVSEHFNNKKIRLPSKRMDTRKLVETLLHLFPKMTLASQSKMNLTGGRIDRQGKLLHFSQCETNRLDENRTRDEDISSNWKCKSLPRTIFCGKKDGTISFFTTDSAYVYDISRGMRVNGRCATECEILFNLDGGGSTQMGYINPKTKNFEVSGSPHGVSLFSNQKENNVSCGSLRPVDHYFVIGTF